MQDSWTALASRLFPTTSGEESRQADLEAVVSRDADMINTLVEIGVSPIDQYNTELLDNVHPANWVDAEPDGVRVSLYYFILFYSRCFVRRLLVTATGGM